MKNFRSTLMFALCSAIASSINHFDGGVRAFVVPTTTTKIVSFPLPSVPIVHNDELRIEEESGIMSVPESRRAILGRAAGGLAATMLTLLSVPSSGIAATMDDMGPVPREAYKKLPSGVIIADLRPGNNGDGVVKNGSRVNLQWVLRKSNGYFVDSSQVAYDGVPFIFVVGDGTAIAGVDEGVQGMASGGVRRLLIPPSLAYVNGLDNDKPGPMPVGFGPRHGH